MSNWTTWNSKTLHSIMTMKIILITRTLNTE